MSDQIPTLTAEELASTERILFSSNKERNVLIDQIKEMPAKTAAYPELAAAYEVLLGIVTSTGISTFAAAVDRVVSLFEPEELFRPQLLTPDGKPLFHRHLIDVLQVWYGPEKPFRKSPPEVLAMWLYELPKEHPLLAKLAEERKSRFEQPLFRQLNGDELPKTPAGSAVPSHSGDAGSSYSHRTDQDLGKTDERAVPVQFTADQLRAAQELQNSRRDPFTRSTPAVAEVDRDEPQIQTFDNDKVIPELLFDWRRATWNADMKLEKRVSGDKALNTSYSSPTAKFSENNTGLVITSVHTAFVQICIRYKLTKITALSYASLLYSGTAHVDYLSYLESCSDENTEVSLEKLFEYMESLYNTRQSRTMAKEALADLRLGNEGTRVAALDVYERNFRKLQAGTGRLSEDTLLHNLQFALRDKAVDFADVISSQISSGNHMTFSSAIAALRAAAATADAKHPRNADTFANTTTDAPPFDNRRLSHTFKRWSKLARGDKNRNPIDRKTGKPMVCRSVGCGSTEHLQYSGRCPVQKRREKEGAARTYMAATIQEDVSRGVAVEDILTEILFSQGNDSVSDSSDGGEEEDGDVTFLADDDLGLHDQPELDSLFSANHKPDEGENFRPSPTKTGIFGSGFSKWWQS